MSASFEATGNNSRPSAPSSRSWAATSLRRSRWTATSVDPRQVAQRLHVSLDTVPSNSRVPNEQHKHEGVRLQGNESSPHWSHENLVSRHRNQLTKISTPPTPEGTWTCRPVINHTNLTSSPNRSHCWLATSSLLLLVSCCQLVHCNPAPSGFLDSGHQIPCHKGQLVNIADHIPIVSPSLNRCYTCSCPNGFVKCDRAVDAPDCMPPTKSAKTSMSLKPSDADKQPKQVTRPGYHLNHHAHLPNTQTVSAKTNNGKAKSISSSATSKPLKSQTSNSGGVSTPIAQPIGGAKQPMQSRAESLHFKMGSGSRLGGVHRSRVQPFGGDSRAGAVEEEPTDESAETFGGGSRQSRTIPKRNHEDMFKPPSLPFNDPAHHAIAAAHFGPRFEERLQHHMRKLATTTTLSPTTLTDVQESLVESEEDMTSNGEVGGNEDDSQQDLTTTTDATTTGTLTPIATTELSIIEEPTQTIWPEPMPPNEQDQGSTVGPELEVDGLNEVDKRHRSESVNVVADIGHKQSQPPFVFSQVDGNAIDHSAANEIMEQVSYDGMFYIAICVEAFILVSIFAMMIACYLFREKTHEDDGGLAGGLSEADLEFARRRALSGQHQQTLLQMPRRSPSIEKA